MILKELPILHAQAFRAYLRSPYFHLQDCSACGSGNPCPPKQNVIEEIRAKEDPITYLGGHFDFPVTLLSVMADTKSVLSGSRALHFFVPESTNAKSDWDFYVPPRPVLIAEMIAVLKLCGVVWSAGKFFAPSRC